MERQNNFVKKSLMANALFISLATLSISTLFVNNHSYSKQSLLSQKVIVLDFIISELGFGKFIHNFKNYVLRGDETYYLKTKENHQLLSNKVDEYLEFGNITIEENYALKEVKKTFDEYKEKLEIVKLERDKPNFKIRDIDQLVKVDDNSAINGIHTLLRKLEEEQRSSIEQAKVVFNIIILMTLILAMVLVYMYIGIIKQIDTAEDKLLNTQESLLNYQLQTSSELKKPIEALIRMHFNLKESIKSENMEKASIISDAIWNEVNNLYQTIQYYQEMLDLDLNTSRPKLFSLNSLIDNIEVDLQADLIRKELTFERAIGTDDEIVHGQKMLRLLILVSIERLINLGEKKNPDSNKLVLSIIDQDPFIKISMESPLLIELENPSWRSFLTHLALKSKGNINDLTNHAGIFVIDKVIKGINGVARFESNKKGTRISFLVPKVLG